MALEWMPRENEPKDHSLHTDGHWGTEAPCVVYEKRPLTGPDGKVIDKLFRVMDSPEQSHPVQFLHNGNGQRGHCRV